ncbi:MAG: ABC transporter substrate-binding protein [Planctomycetota bacterium]
MVRSPLRAALGPLLLVLVLGAAVFAQRTAPDRWVDEAVYGLPPGLDPHLVFAPWWGPMFRLGYETALVCDPGAERLELAPRLLAEMPTLDEETGTVLTLVFREGVRFHDDPCFPEGKGRELVAADYAFMIRRHADPGSGSPFWPAYFRGRIEGLDAARAQAEEARAFDYDAPIKGIEIVSKRVLRIRFLEPYPQFLALMTMPWFSVVPREAVRRYGTGLGRRTVGTGPYRFAEAASDDKTLAFERYAGYWNAAAGGEAGALPRNEGVRFHLVTEMASQDQRFRNGELDLLDLYPQNRGDFVNALDRLSAKVRPLGSRLVRNDASRLHYVSFDARNKILGKVEVRRALALAFDREDFVKRFYRGNAVLADHVVPPSLPLHAPSESYPWKYGNSDVKEARRLLAAAGYPGGEGLPEFTLDFAYTGEAAETEARLIARSWARIGVKVQPRFQDLPAFRRRLADGAVEISVAYWFADYPDAENFFLMLRSSAAPQRGNLDDAPNHGSWSNAAYDEAYYASCRLLPGPKRGALYEKLVRIIQDDVPWIFLAHPREETVVGPGITTFPYRSRYAFDYAFVGFATAD